MTPDFVSNPPPFLEWLDEYGVTYFASGANHPGEILGLSSVGINPGVTVNELKAGALEAIESLAQTDVLLFVDSGAFGEISFGSQGPYVAKGKAITDSEWLRRLNVYNEIAQAIGPQAYLVAPDKVAFQQETFARQERFAGFVEYLASLGANILVPLQKGKLSLFEAYLESLNILDLPDMVASIPMKKDATKLSELVEFLQAALDYGAPIPRLHLLGMGPKASQARKVIEEIARTSPETEVFMDSVLITSIAGRSGGKLRGPRLLTVASDAAMYELADAIARGAVPDIPRFDEFMERFDELVTKAARDKVRRRWGSVENVPIIDLQVLYNDFIEKASVTWRKAESIRQLFGDDPPPIDADWRESALGEHEGYVDPLDLRRHFEWLDSKLAEWIYHPAAEAFYAPMVEAPPAKGRKKRRWIASSEALKELEEELRRSREWRELPVAPGQTWMYRSTPSGPDNEWVVLVEASGAGKEGNPLIRVFVDEA